MADWVNNNIDFKNLDHWENLAISEDVVSTSLLGKFYEGFSAHEAAINFFKKAYVNVADKQNMLENIGYQYLSINEKKAAAAYYLAVQESDHEIYSSQYQRIIKKYGFDKITEEVEILQQELNDLSIIGKRETDTNLLLSQ